MRKFSLQLGTLLLVVMLCGSSAVFALDLFLPEEIRPGLRGIGKTVISGSTIESFDVEILGLVPQSPPLSNLIMVRVSGDAMERSGGIAQGMSGTPVYVQGRLLGAIGYTYAKTDHRIGLVTPAVDMFKMYDQIETTSPVLPLDVAPVRSPLVVQGLNQRNIKYLTESLGAEGVQVMPALAANNSLGVQALEPGSMVGVQLLKGDFQVASFGTVTHVQGDGRFVAFGHPFTHRGNVDFFASAAYVHYTLPSLDVPYKIVSLGSTIGRIEQDRAVGIGGSLGSQAQYVPVNIVVRDKDRGIRQEYRVEVVKDGGVMVPLVITSAYQSVDAALDRVGEGTSFVRLEFIGKDFSQRMIRENLFYSDSDIAVWSLTDLLAGLELLMDNSLQEVDLQQIKVEVEVSQERKTAVIETAAPSKSYVKAGESVDVEVTIRPYRGLGETRTLRMTIPPDTAPGLLTVTVRSGGAGYYVVKPPVHTSILEPGEEGDEPMRAVISGASSLDALIVEYMDRERNNEIVAEFYPFLETSGEIEADLDLNLSSDQENMHEPVNYYAWAETPAEATRVRLSTQFVLDGMATFDLNIY